MSNDEKDNTLETPAKKDDLSDSSNDNQISEENQTEEVSDNNDDIHQKYLDTYDALLRAQAEIENVKKRSQKEVENAHKYSIESLLMEIIPIYDSLNLSCSIEENSANIKQILDGNKLLLSMFAKIFEQNNIIEINPLNDKFNPEYHQAISTIDADEKIKPDTISEVVQRGYLLNGRVIKPALVIVAKSK